VDQLPEKKLAPLLDYVRSQARQDGNGSPAWDGPDFIGAFASGHSDVSERADELLFTEGPTGEAADR
jgi:hypothetical protein